jgi:hypothetical protein
MAWVACSATATDEIGEPRGPPWPMTRVALAQAIGHHFLDRKHLRILGDGTNPHCPLTVVETDHRKRTTRRRHGQLLMMVWAVSSVAQAPLTALVAVVMTGGPSLGSN